MCAFKARRGPLQSTQANPRHYSYECKASAQDRPYVSRPSRSQQLRNPKLVPELTGASEPPAKKKGIAAAILAEREAQHAKEREDEDHEETVKYSPKRLEPASVSSALNNKVATYNYSGHYNDTNQSRIPSRRQRSPEPQDDGRRRVQRRSLSRSPPHHDTPYSAPSRRRRSPEPHDSDRQLHGYSRNPSRYEKRHSVSSRREHDVNISDDDRRRSQGAIYKHSSSRLARSPITSRRGYRTASSDDQQEPRRVLHRATGLPSHHGERILQKRKESSDRPEVLATIVVRRVIETGHRLARTASIARRLPSKTRNNHAVAPPVAVRHIDSSVRPRYLARVARPVGGATGETLIILSVHEQVGLQDGMLMLSMTVAEVVSVRAPMPRKSLIIFNDVALDLRKWKKGVIKERPVAHDTATTNLFKTAGQVPEPR
ncbi:hypothetical protein CP532_5811 [Ophiocordyceps camponoti-leonardi (nom. inval.)]|nr:hypothetical protein CP532_5811 [Ophiocordyceps camponoti-leonardi (nom. inval.)]